MHHSQDLSRVLQYKTIGQEALWQDCAEKLTAMIQNIIEFAKLIPGFMRLSQDDQVRMSITHRYTAQTTAFTILILVFFLFPYM